MHNATHKQRREVYGALSWSHVQGLSYIHLAPALIKAAGNY